MADPTAPGGTAQSHPEKVPPPILVAPTTQVDLNTIKAFLIPVGCWRVDDVRFAFDSSVIHPDVKTETAMLDTLRKAHPGAPLSIFGHADPTGRDDYNKTLSGRRATAVYAMLTRDVAKWEKLYLPAFGGDDWGLKSIQLMLNEVAGTSIGVDGQTGPETQGAIKDYQKSKGLSPSGSADQATRAKLFADYMDHICVDAAGTKFQLQKSDFLAKGADPDGKGDLQGCGEFNPFVVFSNDETKQFESDHVTRDNENAPNRRVMALLFKPGTVINTAKWPCPKVTDGVAGCKARFWSDGETRRNPQAKRRTFDTDKNTYGCRFYHRLFVLSPCGAGSGKTTATVLKITASIDATKEIRHGSAKKRPTKTLRESISKLTSLVANPPGAILVQGCKDVDLVAVLSPGLGDVVWTVDPTDNPNSGPTITRDEASPNKTKAKLSSAKGGSFSVTATVGASKVVWNVVFVAVKINMDKVPKIDLRKTEYADGFQGFVSDANFTRFTSGQFVTHHYAFEVFFQEVNLVGGGLDGKLGVDQITTRFLQNIVGESLTGHYQGGATAIEQFQIGGKVVPFDIVDSQLDADANPFFFDGQILKIDSPTGTPRTVRAGDAPAGQFPRHHSNGHLLERVEGSLDFHSAIGSTAADAPDAIVLHAEMRWQAHYDGDVATTGANGTYTPNGARTTGDATVTLISPDTNGKDAADALFETFEPRAFIARTNVFQ
jgi:hypothetical protein